MAAAAAAGRFVAGALRADEGGLTSANAGPARFAFVRSQAAKERPARRSRLNVAKTMSALVTVIVAYDVKFYDSLPKLFHRTPDRRAVPE